MILCPVCEKSGLPEGTLLCPQCNADLTCFDSIDRLLIMQDEKEKLFYASPQNTDSSSAHVEKMFERTVSPHAFFYLSLLIGNFFFLSLVSICFWNWSLHKNLEEKILNLTMKVSQFDQWHAVQLEKNKEKGEKSVSESVSQSFYKNSLEDIQRSVNFLVETQKMVQGFEDHSLYQKNK